MGDFKKSPIVYNWLDMLQNTWQLLIIIKFIE